MQFMIMQTLPVQALDAACRKAEQNGLVLTMEQRQMLCVQREQTLRNAGRLEVGPGVLPALIETFSQSPYLDKRNAVQELTELQQIFYAAQNLTHDTLRDADLLAAMRSLYDGLCGGDTAELDAAQRHAVGRIACVLPTGQLREKLAAAARRAAAQLNVPERPLLATAQSLAVRLPIAARNGNLENLFYSRAIEVK